MEVSSQKQTLWDEFKRKYNASPPYTYVRKNFEKCEDYTDVFLCHARVYVFAEKYDIAELRKLALCKLKQILQDFHVYDERIEDIVSLIRYSYNNDNTRDNEPGEDIDTLRRLVIHYVVCLYETIAKDDGFLVLVEEGGPFARDLVNMSLRRIA